MQAISPPPQVNYVALSPMPSNADEDESLTISSLPYDLDPVVDMVISSVGILEPNLSTLIKAIDMYAFQHDFLPSSEALLEAIVDINSLTCFPSKALSSWDS
jgi:hypothetical protein